MANPIQAVGNAFQAICQPIANNITNGIEDLKKRHHHAFGTPKVLQRQAPRVIVPPRPAPFAAIIPGDSVGEAVLTTGLLNFLSLYNSALIIRLVLTWFPNPPEVIVSPLATVTDPYLNLFRGIIPPIGGTLDLSPILAFVTLNFFTSSAAALPCEMGSDGSASRGRRQQQGNSPFSFLQPSRFQQAWAQRVQAQRAAREAQNPATPTA